MKYLLILAVSAVLSGCVSASDHQYTMGYFPPAPQYTRTYTAPKPRANAQEICVTEDYYIQRVRAWVREERCHWR